MATAEQNAQTQLDRTIICAALEQHKRQLNDIARQVLSTGAGTLLLVEAAAHGSAVQRRLFGYDTSMISDLRQQYMDQITCRTCKYLNHVEPNDRSPICASCEADIYREGE